LNADAVEAGWLTSRSRAAWPTMMRPLSSAPTTEGVSSTPSALGMSTGAPSRQTPIKLLVVPRSMPTIMGESYARRMREESRGTGKRGKAG